MNLFKTKIYKNVGEALVSLLLVITLFISMSTPQIVNAETLEDITSLTITLNTTIKIGQEDIQFGFPIAGSREPRRSVKVVATAYTSEVWQTDSTPCITANGFDLCKFYADNGFGNTIAANFLALGTQVRFPELYGDKVFVVRDRMNARYYNGRVDIWMNDLHEAKLHGAKRLVMEVF